MPAGGIWCGLEHREDGGPWSRVCLRVAVCQQVENGVPLERRENGGP